MKKGVDFSAIITVHNEGLLAHKTMLSVFQGLEKVREDGYSYEIIIHIDNGDKKTKQYFGRYKKDDRIKIFENSFGDPGASRNYAVGKASGQYVTFLDGDDLMSDNWFREGIKELKKAKTETIVYPEAVLTFGLDLKQNVLSIQKPSYGLEKDTIIMLGENRWCSVVMARKETFEKVSYRRLDAGYSHEDYVFNIETIEAGIRHAIAKNTVLFYRRSDQSRLSISGQNHATIPYMKLFDFGSVKELKEVPLQDLNEKLRNRWYRLYKSIRNNKYLNFFITPVAKLTLRVMKRKTDNEHQVPKFVIEAWKNINKIETQLYPYAYLVKKVQFYEAERQALVGNIYLKVAKALKNKNHDYVFIVPWLVAGGADKVMLNYIKALHEMYGWSFAVIVSLAADNQWEEELPDYVDFIDFGKISQVLSPEQQENLFTRIIIQLQCKRLHIINSEYGYTWARKHLELLKNHFVLNVSLFCEEYVPGSEMRGMFSYDDPYLLSVINVVNKVFTDNRAIIERSAERNGFNKEKFKVHYQPLVEDFKSVDRRRGKKLRILWAGRIAYQKCPEVLCQIANMINEEKVEIEVFGRFDGYNESIFTGVNGLKYRGEFNGFSSLDTDSYDVYLYTSNIDGVPNCLLEASASGLPIIAPNVGGIGEFVINNKTGLLIDKFDDVAAFVRAINFAEKNPEKMKRMAENAQKHLKEQHSWEEYTKTLKSDLN